MSTSPGGQGAKGAKFGVYLSPDLVGRLEQLAHSLGTSKSRIVQEALRLYIVESEWSVAREVAGSINVLYDHEERGVDEKLTDIQHKYLDVVVSAMHVHLDEKRCMLVVAVRGESSKVKSLIDEVRGLRGVLLVRPVLLAALG